jgi:phage replication O-like protein O
VSRDSYAYVGASIREAQARAIEAGDLVGRDWRVLLAIIALVASYSRTSDKITSQQIADAAGMDVRHAKRSLARLIEHGIITRESTVGRRPARTGLPTPRPSLNHEPGPQTATVDHHEPGPQTATVETSEPGPQTATVETRQQWPERAANSGRRRPPTREETREESFAREAASPSGSAVGRPSTPIETFEEIGNPRLRELFMRVVTSEELTQPTDPTSPSIKALTA